VSAAKAQVAWAKDPTHFVETRLNRLETALACAASVAQGACLRFYSSTMVCPVQQVAAAFRIHTSPRRQYRE
jgi:hypothetical protein